MALMNAAAADAYKRAHADEFPPVVVEIVPPPPPPPEPKPAPIPQTPPAEDKFPGLTGKERQRAKNRARLDAKWARNREKTEAMLAEKVAARDAAKQPPKLGIMATAFTQVST
jgi:hypothetical protein